MQIAGSIESWLVGDMMQITKLQLARTLSARRGVNASALNEPGLLSVDLPEVTLSPEELMSV